ncbi:MAG TPA: deoxynucleoside kinase [Anaerolineales bacterium]|nr:deoxynucleoside kinase [Anaerolineales bacterium]
MGKLIVVVGNSGLGKTTFTRQLCRAYPFVTGMEQHQERPFQLAFSGNHSRYGLHNQVDYLLFRAGQELFIRRAEVPGVLDGGLELDFFVFTRYFHLRGYLTMAEYQLCERVYSFFRAVLPPPDLILRLTAPLEVVAARYAHRNRSLEIARLEDLGQLEILIDDWIGKVQDIPVVSIDASREDPGYGVQIAKILPKLKSILGVG